MRRLLPLPLLAALTVAGCAANMGAPREIPVATVALRAESATDPGVAGMAIRQAGARAALLVSRAPEIWYRSVATAAGLQLSGPARTPDGLGLAFLGPEPLGDTAIDLRYEGGSFVLQDALYELDDERYLDLLAFEVTEAAAARPLIASLLAYVATDVNPSAAVVMAVAVPNGVVGDSVARMLSPGFDDARRCGGGAGDSGEGLGVRLFYGPEARIFCRTASAEEVAAGALVRAELVMGRR